MGKHKIKEIQLWGLVKPSVSYKVINERDLIDVKKYQSLLVDYLCYETSSKKEPYKQSRIMKEIKDIELWLKKNYPEFINNNNRKFELE
jgi:hypothetical protein